MAQQEMGRYVFTLPDVGEGIAEVELVAWHTAVGAEIEEDAPLVDVLTEKATVEIPSPRSGRVISITGKPGDKIRVGSEILVLATEAAAGASPAAPAGPAPGPTEETPAPEAPEAARAERGGEDRAVSAAPKGSTLARKLAAPSVRHRAKELGIALDSVSGTGPGGRIVHADLDALLARAGAPEAPPPVAAGTEEDIEEIRIIGLRRRIAERMQQSKRQIPHYSYVEEIDVSALEELRAELNVRHAEERPRLTVLPFLIAALVRAVPKFPQINAWFDEGQGVLRRYRAVHAGIATATREGLLVPVVRHAEKLDLWQAALEIARLSGAAREGRAKREELTGSTITITSLGPLGGIMATPVINPPEVAIIGVNRIAERPVVRAGAIVIRRMMNLSSSFDHRIVDGFEAAQFTQEMKRLLEQPATLFIR